MVDHGFGIEAEAPNNVIIKNDGFYPDLSTGEFREWFALNASMSSALLLDFITLAIIQVNRQLQKVKDQWKKQGFKVLSEVSASQVGEQSELITLYKSAVFFAAYASIESSEYRQGRSPLNADERMDNASVYLQKSHFAIAGLHKKPRIEALMI